MSLVTPLRKAASKLMAKFGGVATLRNVVSGIYNPVTGTATETTVDVVLRGIIEDITRREVNGLIQAGDKRLTIAAADTSVTPTTADRVLISSRTLQVIEVRIVEQDNTPITYELILRD